MEIYLMSSGKKASKTTWEMLLSLLLCIEAVLGEFCG